MSTHRLTGSGASLNDVVVAADANNGARRVVERIRLYGAAVTTFTFETPAATGFLGPYGVLAGETIEIEPHTARVLPRVSGGALAAEVEYRANAALVVDVATAGATAWMVEVVTVDVG